MACAEQIAVLQKQGAMHGFLLLLDENGKEIAVGDQINIVHGNEIHSRLEFHFHDGSIDDETTDFRQTSVFELIRDYHVQKGPSFPKPSDVTIDVPVREVRWVESSAGKPPRTRIQHVDLPPDLINGMVSMVPENFPPKATEVKVSYLAVESKPRVVSLKFAPDGSERVRLGESHREADRFNVHVDLGGVAGAVAPVIGKQPPDMEIWTIRPIPTFVKMVAPLYNQGPLWTMELGAPR
ncbi:hypothetical protein DYQ86_08260 [Acidobacteria bacterium AB60]|nr:hypothetical protein DYQ86_08260 [Acidobacteria bacterium AB60]